MDHLIDLFKKNSPFLQRKKVLIVDDEADFASRNYKAVKLPALKDEEGNPIVQDAETEMAKISQQIDDFRKIPVYCRYLQVTATPYCLYLQPQGELNLNGKWVKPFRPRFTSIVPTHEAYVGGDQYFIESKNPDSMYSHLFHQVEQKCIDVLGHEDKRYLNNTVSSGNIYGLTYSLVSYFMATAIRRIQVREEKNKDYKTSALIHVELDKKNHEWQYRVVSRLIDAIKNAVVDEDQSDQRIWNAFDVNYEDFKESNRKGREEGLIKVNIPSKEDVMDEIRNIFNKDSIKYIKSESREKSKCQCAWYVMRALQKGGCYPCLIYPAYSYKDILPRLGAKEINESEIQAGDICVISQNSLSAFGHICIYDGEYWYSDFKQGIKHFPYKEKYKKESSIQFFHIEDGWHTANIWISPFEAIEYLICLIKNINKLI